MSVAEVLNEAGFDVLGPARSADQALALIAKTRPDLAVLDVNLGNETSARVALELERQRVPFLCVSGYSVKQVPEPLSHAPLLTKPVADAALLTAVRAAALSGGARGV